MMKRTVLGIVAFAFTQVLCSSAPASAQQAPSSNAIPVTVDNFVRAESDRYFGVVEKEGGFGKLNHRRALMPIDKQTVYALFDCIVRPRCRPRDDYAAGRGQTIPGRC
jgi:hypothetical protein